MHDAGAVWRTMVLCWSMESDHKHHQRYNRFEKREKEANNTAEGYSSSNEGTTLAVEDMKASRAEGTGILTSSSPPAWSSFHSSRVSASSRSTNVVRCTAIARADMRAEPLEKGGGDAGRAAVAATDFCNFVDLSR